MNNINEISLFTIPTRLNNKMVIMKPQWIGEHAVHTWERAVSILSKNFWGAGADCGFQLEARAVFEEGGTYRIYDAVVDIYKDGRHTVRLVH